MITTGYGSWHDITKQSETVIAYIGDALGDHIHDYDLVALEKAYRAAIADALPEGVELAGREFYGPYEGREGIVEALPAAIESIDFWALAERCEKA